MYIRTLNFRARPNARLLPHSVAEGWHQTQQQQVAAFVKSAFVFQRMLMHLGFVVLVASVMGLALKHPRWANIEGMIPYSWSYWEVVGGIL